MNFLSINDPIKSTSGLNTARFDLVNHSGKTLNIYWVDFNGKEILYNQLGAGQTMHQGVSSSNHVWEARSDDGSIAFKFVLDKQFGQIDVTASGPTFTPYLDRDINTSLGEWNTYTGYGILNAAKSLGIAETGELLPMGGKNNNLALDLIKAPDAWKAGYTGKGVKVAVLDMGIAYDNAEVKDNIVGGIDLFQKDNAPYPDKGAYMAHGLGIASLIAGKADFKDGPDVTGVAPDAQILNVRTGGGTVGNPLDLVVNGIRWAVDNGAKVICIPQGSDDTSAQPESIRKAVEYAYDHNSVVVFAGGNSSMYGASSFALLAKEGKCIAVGNLDVTSGLPFDSSNLPGENPFPWVMAASSGYVATPEGSYQYYRDGGTSFASPYVAGVAALLFQQNPNADAKTIINKILTGATGGNKDGVVTGDASANVFQNSAAVEKFDGRDGVDTLIYHGHRADFKVEATSDGFKITDKVSGTIDTLLNIERVKFDDGAVALDVGANTHAGAVYRLYQACLNRAPDQAGLGFWAAALDAGKSLKDVAAGFINSNEFAQLYGTNVSDEVFITNLYKNVLHREPDADGFAFHIKALHNGTSRVDEVLGFSESTENVAQLIGVMKNGVDYIPIS